jgi:Holliday junction resolvase
MGKQNREAEIASHVVTWLLDNQFKVYQEVSAGSSVADIVAVLGTLHWVIECKTTVGLTVIAQADYWREFAHMRSIAIPKPARGTKASRYARKCLDRDGVGLIFVTEDTGGIREECRPSLFRKPPRLGELKGSLCSEQQNGLCPAGSAGGGHWTTFKDTVRRITRYVEKNPGATMKEILDNVPHHYSSGSSARGCLVRYIKEGIIDGIESRKDGRRAVYFIKPKGE